MPLQLDLSSAEEQRLRLTQEQEKVIHDLYKKASEEIGRRAEQAPRVPSDYFNQQYLWELQGQINDQLKVMEGQIGTTIRSGMEQMSRSTVDSAKQLLSDVGMPIKAAYSHVPADVVRAVASGQLYGGNWTLSKALWLNTKNTQTDIQAIVAKGIAENKSAYDIAKDLEKYVNPDARKDWEWSKVYPGTRKVVDYNAQRLARTMVSHAYQQAFVRTTIKNPFVTKYQWQAAGTERTCEICNERDGQYYPKDELPLDHPNGMCTFIAVIEDSMEDIADRLADWAHGGDDPELDEWAKDLYGDKWQDRIKEIQSEQQASAPYDFKTHVNNYDSNYAQNAPKKKKDIKSDELFRQELARAFETGKPKIQRSEDGVIDILTSGRVKTVFETLNRKNSWSSLETYMSIRKITEKDLFGVPTDTSPKDRPVYAYLDCFLNRGTQAASSYGPISIILDPDKIKSRTTWTAGDSISQEEYRLAPAMWGEYHYHGGWTKDLIPYSEYMELQIHGGVTLQDIKEIQIKGDISDRLMSALESSGVPWSQI